MSDLINRQAAIQALEDADVLHCERIRAIDAIKGVPAVPQWIPVLKRMPERSVEVLTYTENVNLIEIQSLEVSDGMRHWENQHGDWQDERTVTAWMPLPEVCREEDT